MSDGGRDRASLGVEVWKSSQKWSARRSAVRSIAWLDLVVFGKIIVPELVKPDFLRTGVRWRRLNELERFGVFVVSRKLRPMKGLVVARVIMRLSVQVSPDVPTD